MSAESIGFLSQNIELGWLWQFLAKYSEPCFIFLLVIFWIIWLLGRHARWWRAAVSITTGLGITVPVSYLLRGIINRPRPFQTAVFEPLIEHGGGAGLPSNHAVATAVFAVCLFGSGNLKTAIVITFLTIMVGLSRVFAGLHYPGDILLGWLVGGVG
ncbi:MAG: phosphatase PAP2 family protein, partial [bacterium]